MGKLIKSIWYYLGLNMLNLSTKGRYAARIVVYMAMKSSEKPIRKQEIADSEGISADYVEQLLLRLKQKGLVISYRGAHGGFSLGVDPGEITVADVLEAVEGPISLVSCQEEGCSRATVCVTHPVWDEAREALLDVFRRARISELAQQAREKRAPASLDYAI